MRQVTRIGKRGATLPFGKKKVGRPRKNTLIQQMEKSGDPDITFVQDLRQYDRTEVQGKDENFEYRWVRADRIAERERQGYAKADDASVKSYHDGNFWNPEGKDSRLAKGGSVLMKIPKERFELRRRIKEEAIEQNSIAEDTRLRASLAGEGSQVLPDSDEFVQELSRR
jgi:hypothetical protein